TIEIHWDVPWGFDLTLRSPSDPKLGAIGPDRALNLLKSHGIRIESAEAQAFTAKINATVADFKRRRFPPAAAPEVRSFRPTTSSTIYHPTESAPVFTIVPFWFVCIAAIFPTIWRGHRRRYATFA